MSREFRKPDNQVEVSWDDLTDIQQHRLEEAYYMDTIGEHGGFGIAYSDEERLVDLKLLSRRLTKAGRRHNEYAYAITGKGRALFESTEKLKRRNQREAWFAQVQAGKLTEQQFLDLLDAQNE